MRTIFRLIAALLSAATPALANHPGENLDQVMAATEAAFEPTPTRSVPVLNARSGPGTAVALDELKGKIVVVSFVPRGCGAPCTAQQEQLGQALGSLNAGPMREMVEFVSVSDSPLAVTGPADNWTYAWAGGGQTAQTLAAAFAAQSERQDETPMIHLLDRGGRQVGIFHGSEFLPLNLVLYLNGLTNAHPQPEPGVFERLFGWLP
ncbi:hypothetical protein D6850_10970 [Roseovarius spongiae]|uniref:SCO family protein n=1 Tax=Roseovarius spongiae TaxID=2320272 RepID=A0A3A8BA55_9RHOB|nr:hypothetical protein [Roseovarius spongiae]RKF15333.1 hypothetical protein D6850_10970 [Roseovarius spongiae]